MGGEPLELINTICQIKFTLFYIWKNNICLCIVKLLQFFEFVKKLSNFLDVYAFVHANLFIF